MDTLLRVERLHALAHQPFRQQADAFGAARSSNLASISGVNRSPVARWWASRAQNVRAAFGRNRSSTSSKTRSKASKKWSWRSSPIWVSDWGTPRR